MRASYFTFNPPGRLCRCRCGDNHPQKSICEWYMDATQEGVCGPCGVFLDSVRDTVIRELVEVLEGTPTNAIELKGYL